MLHCRKPTSKNKYYISDSDSDKSDLGKNLHPILLKSNLLL